MIGDVLFSKDGTIGRTTVVDTDRPFAIASSLVIIRPDANVVNSDFLNFWLNHSLLKQDVELQLAGAALRRISIEKVARISVALPPLSEQVHIAKKIECELNAAESLSEHVDREIELLTEMRAATITDAVLGRIDVRKAQAH